MPRSEVEIQSRETTSGNPLASLIEQKIQKEGPIPFSDYMHTWSHGAIDRNGQFVAGYYSGNPVIGDNDKELPEDEAHFFTPSEKSPLYGLVMASEIRKMWNSMGQPDDFKIVEMGAGNGTLANDILHGIIIKDNEDEGLKKLSDSIKYIIVEQSGVLGQKQRDKLGKFGEKVQIVRGTAAQLPLRGIKGVFLSVELPDAFPVHPLKREGEQIKELYVDRGDNDNFESVWIDAGTEVKNIVEEYGLDIPEDSIYPLNKASVLWMDQMSAALEQGYVITVDYDRNDKYPIRVYGNKKIGIDLDDPNLIFRKRFVGQTDITAGIDFKLLAQHGKKKGLKPFSFMNQSGLLWGNCYDMMMKKYGTRDEGFVTDRRFMRSRANELLYDQIWYVLVQSKNVEGGEEIKGTHYYFNHDDKFAEHLYKEAQKIDWIDVKY